MAAGKQVSAIDIKRLWYCDALASAGDEALTASTLGSKIRSAVEIKNIHQDTWTIDESEASQDSYKNQLTGSTYRMGSKSMGEVTFSFTIGRYDYDTKAALMGGVVIKKDETTPIGWSRQRGITDVKKMLIALTEDGVYCVLPYANVIAREANTDGAVGIAVTGTMLEPPSENVSPEYWFDESEITIG